MKKIILLALTALMMVGCKHYSNPSKSYEGYTKATYIDSCEYLVSGTQIGYTFTHKGNCRFCEERDSIKWKKRKKELKELVEQLLKEK